MHRNLHVGSRVLIDVMSLNMTPGMAHPQLPAVTYGNVFEQFNRTVHHLGQNIPATATDPAYEPVVLNAPDPNPARNFIWLPYHPGRVTLVRFQPDISILTGWMSGCWLALVQVNGVEYFAHVGTDDNPNHPNTLAVKNGIKLAIGTSALSVLQAFQPVCPTSVKRIGVISPSRNFYTLGVTPCPPSITAPGTLKSHIDSKTRVPPAPSLPYGY
jgi:hypothetical protein